jgi:hypothetical protein
MYFSSTLFATAFLTLANGEVLGKRSLSGEATFYVRRSKPLPIVSNDADLLYREEIWQEVLVHSLHIHFPPTFWELRSQIRTGITQPTVVHVSQSPVHLETPSSQWYEASCSL